MFCNLDLTDMETCYKVFRTDLLKSIPIRSDRFGFEPEIVMKSAKRRFRIYEVPISYHGRTYEEGKKIGWKDGVKALGVVLKFWLIDDLYTAPYGRDVANNLSGTPQYVNWITHGLKPHLGDTVLEMGAGIGNVAADGRRLLDVAAEDDPLHLHALRNRFLRTPNVEVRKVNPASQTDLDARRRRVRHRAAAQRARTRWPIPVRCCARCRACLPRWRTAARAGPRSKRLFGSLDEQLGHKQRLQKRRSSSVAERIRVSR